MRILLVADLHYALKKLDWLCLVAADFELVILAGDHLDISSHVDGRTQITVFLKYLQRLKALTQLVISSGNHDLDARNADGEKTAGWFARIRRMGIPTDGSSVLVEDLLVSVCPWWDGPMARNRIGEQLASDAGTARGKWAWVYHGPPQGSATSWDGSKWSGDDALGQWIIDYEPDLVFCGHVHNSPFSRGGSWIDRIGRTWVFNAGHEFGPTPPYIAISTDCAEAVWVSSAGIELVNLDEPLARPPARLAELPPWLIDNSRARGRIPA